MSGLRKLPKMKYLIIPVFIWLVSCTKTKTTTYNVGTTIVLFAANDAIVAATDSRRLFKTVIKGKDAK